MMVTITLLLSSRVCMRRKNSCAIAMTVNRKFPLPVRNKEITSSAVWSAITTFISYAAPCPVQSIPRSISIRLLSRKSSLKRARMSPTVMPARKKGIQTSVYINVSAAHMLLPSGVVWSQRYVHILLSFGPYSWQLRISLPHDIYLLQVSTVKIRFYSRSGPIP